MMADCLGASGTAWGLGVVGTAHSLGVGGMSQCFGVGRTAWCLGRLQLLCPPNRLNQASFDLCWYSSVWNDVLHLLAGLII